MSLNSNIVRVLELKSQIRELEAEVRSITMDRAFVMDLVSRYPNVVSINWTMLRRMLARA